MLHTLYSQHETLQYIWVMFIIHKATVKYNIQPLTSDIFFYSTSLFSSFVFEPGKENFYLYLNVHVGVRKNW